MQDEKTGEVTVYCDAESHELWERTYSRRGDAPWMPDPFEYVGGERGNVRTPRRGGGLEFIDAAGKVVRFWDTGRGVTDRDGAKRLVDEIARARNLAGVDQDTDLSLGRRYPLRCPLCGDAIRRSDAKANEQFNWLWTKGFTRISLNNLRKLDRLL
jgi:hypothetical protein